MSAIHPSLGRPLDSQSLCQNIAVFLWGLTNSFHPATPLRAGDGMATLAADIHALTMWSWYEEISSLCSIQLLLLQKRTLKGTTILSSDALTRSLYICTSKGRGLYNFTV
eukprot:GHVO01030812.1.p1 GENE.GHVO01030812.1~~GHVO01030812.1.p1  ORF type:complete len:110 (+),score=2.18 GHVO01030812.1:90-419(+)